jgi:hypothetical protein
MGLVYRWTLDFVGPLMTTSMSAKYVLVIIEYFNKRIELVPLQYVKKKMDTKGRVVERSIV